MNDTMVGEASGSSPRQLADEAARLFEAFRRVPERSVVESWLGREVADGEYRDARVDYTTLCCSTQADGPLPYESVYENEGRRLMGDCLDEVKLAYALMGYEVPNDLSREPEDHIAIELDFLSHAYRKAVGSGPEKGELLDLAESFKEEHLDSWVSRYSEEGFSVVDGEFYRMVLEELRDFARR